MSIDQESNPDDQPEYKGTDTEPAAVTELALPEDILPTTLNLLPTFERPFFPIQTMALTLPADPWRETIAGAEQAAHHTLGIVLARPEADEAPSADALHRTGCAIRIHQVTERDEHIHLIAEGLKRFRIIQWLEKKAPHRARVEYLEETADASDKEYRAYTMAIIGTIKKLIPLNPLYNEELKLFMERFTPNQPSFLTDFAANLTTAAAEELQEVLATRTLLERMEKVLVLLRKELEIAELHMEISTQVEQKLSEQQRKFFLQEQLKVIQQELGISKDDRTAEVDRFRARMAGLQLSDGAKTRVEEELEKLAILEQGSPEYGVTRNYLDWLTALPWGRYSKDRLDLKRARRIMDRDHAGLADVKERIIEFLAVGRLRGEIAGSILLFVGPPGVGKTSIGRSIAEALGRKFYRLSVGGMRDEAEIKGHRRTYIGAMPGKFLQALKELDSANPVIMLDEVDKIGASYQGDPASALLEVLDPEQNSDFLDHYIDVRFDLSKALFICTANQLDTIPKPLLDRMEMIRLAGYIGEEKYAIAQKHLWPRVLERAGIAGKQLRLSDAALRKVIEGYAREAGVRGLEKQLRRIVRKAAISLAKNASQRLSVNARNLAEYLGQPLFQTPRPLSGVGVVTGLAWTSLGGTTLAVEATRVHCRNRGFRLTGQLGEVMRESAEIAYSYIASHLDSYGGDSGFFDDAHVHLHVPEGATPKDGPSAGITMATALLSLARGQKLPRPLAMTGELTLTGQVFPVGGIREKIIAVRRNRIHEVILPRDNQSDFEALPAHLRQGLTIHYADHYRNVFRIVFESVK